MLTYFPNSMARKSMTTYFVTLAVISLLFLSKVLPFVMILFGVVAVVTFFYFSNDLTKRWRSLHPKVFVKKLFWTGLIVRLLYMVVAYFFYDAMTGQPFMFNSADELGYYAYSQVWHDQGYGVFREMVKNIGLGDSGEICFTNFLCFLFGTSVFTARIGHCVLSALTSVLIYRIGKRHFGESTGRMAGIFCMLMPNLIYYCGLHLKEADMVFVTVLFVDCVDVVLSDHKVVIPHIIFAVLSGFVLFTFRTALGAVGLIATLVAVVFNKGKLGSWWKRILLGGTVIVSLSVTTVGTRLQLEMLEIWEESATVQAQGMENRSKSTGGNAFAKYASGAVFAPMIFTIPFPTMVNTEIQKNQQMIHGGNFVKNIMSGLTIFALFLLLLSGEWRKHTLPIAMMCGYLVVVAFSHFAYSERFHQPALPFELLFAAFGISQVKQKHLKWFEYWTYFIFVANIGWAWIKLAGRGLV